MTHCCIAQRLHDLRRQRRGLWGPPSQRNESRYSPCLPVPHVRLWTVQRAGAAPASKMLKPIAL